MTLRNDEAGAVEASLTPSGPFADSISVPSSVNLASGEQKTIRVYVSSPSNAEPGTIEGGILIESHGAGGGTVSASSAVFHAIRLVTPQQGPHLEGELIAASSSVGTPTLVTLALRNTGTEDVDATVQISAGTQKLTTQQVSVPTGSVKNVIASWTPSQLGQYTLAARASYADKALVLDRQMTVGDLSVRIINVSVGEFVLGRPFRIAVDAQSAWGEPLPVVASAAVAQNGAVKQSGESIPIMLEPGEQTSIPVFLESQGLEEGEAELRIQVVYAGQVETSSTPIYITGNRIILNGKAPQRAPSQALTTGLALFTVAVFIIIFIIWFRSSRRKGV